MEVDVELGILHSNNMSNSEGKFEILEDLDMNQIMGKEGKCFWIREYLLDIKVNENPCLLL